MLTHPSCDFFHNISYCTVRVRYSQSKNEEGVASMSTLKEKIAAKFTPDAAAATATNEYALSQDASSAMA